MLVFFLPGTGVNFDTKMQEGKQLTGNLHEEKRHGHLLDLDESRTSDNSFNLERLAAANHD